MDDLQGRHHRGLDRRGLDAVSDQLGVAVAYWWLGTLDLDDD